MKKTEITIEGLANLIKSTIEENRNNEDKPLVYDYPHEWKNFDIEDLPSEGVEYGVDFPYKECYEDQELAIDYCPHICTFYAEDEDEYKRDPAYLRYLFEFELECSYNDEVYIRGFFLHTIVDDSRHRRDEWKLK